MAQAGYSGTPLPAKLGLKDGQRVLFAGLPAGLQELTRSRAFAAVVRRDALAGFGGEGGPFDVIHAFTRKHAELSGSMDALEAAITADGTIWVSWPKKAAKIETDLTEDVVRAEALARDLVDVKVCAVDDVWSGLKLVIRKDRRHLHQSNAPLH